jgi:hypothetical protein
VVWLPISSAAGSNTALQLTSTTWFDTGYTISFLNPVAAVRMNSTSLTAGTTTIITMKVIQGDGW